MAVVGVAVVGVATYPARDFGCFLTFSWAYSRGVPALNSVQAPPVSLRAGLAFSLASAEWNLISTGLPNNMGMFNIIGIPNVTRSSDDP